MNIGGTNDQWFPHPLHA